MTQYAWFETPSGRAIFKRVPTLRVQPSRFPRPMIRKDGIDPVQSMADGKTYDSLSELRRSYRADGNPQGVEYTEVGTEKRVDPVMSKVSKAEVATLLDKAEAAIARGEVPEMRSVHEA